MIYTITFNPALDYVVKVKDLKIGEVNRANNEEIYPGGKGINVSIVLKNLGIENIALGYVAGFTGKEIQRRVNELGCKTDFIQLKNGMSRINVKLQSIKESEINGIGPYINDEELNALYEKLYRINDDDIVVLSGSIPNMLPQNTYANIMKNLESYKVKFIVDTSSNLLLNVLKYKPFLIKPNEFELSDLFKVKIKSEEEIIFYAKKLVKKGAENVLVSMADKGAILITSKGEVLRAKAPNGIVKNSVGAGDSMVAGFIAGYLQSFKLEDGLKMGIITGSASAFSDGLATKEKVEELLKHI